MKVEDKNVSTPQLLLLVLLSLIQGSSFLYIKVAVDYLSPLTIVFLRVLIALPFVFFFIALKKQALLSTIKANWCVLFTLSLFAIIIPFSLITWASQTIPSGVASVYMAFIPIYVAILEVTFRRQETFKPYAYLGLILGLLGVILLSSGDIRAHGIGNLQGHVLCLLGGACFAIAIYKTKALSFIPPMIISFSVMTFAAVVLLPVVLVTEDWAFTPTIQLWLSILGLSILSTAGGYFLLYYLIDKVGTVITSTTNYLVPLFGMTLGYIFLNETLNWLMIPAVALILVGLYLVSHGKKKERIPT